MKFRDADGIEVVEIAMLNVGFFRVMGNDGCDHGVFLEPDYTMDPERIKKDFHWVGVLEKCGIHKTGPVGMMFYQKGGTIQWPYTAIEKSYKDEPEIRVMYRPPVWKPIIIDDSETTTRRMKHAHRN